MKIKLLLLVSVAVVGLSLVSCKSSVCRCNDIEKIETEAPKHKSPRQKEIDSIKTEKGEKKKFPGVRAEY